MKCYGLGESMWVDPDTGLLEVHVAEDGGLEIIPGEGLSLQEAQKQPVWTTWVPTLTNMTQGNGTVTARYFNQGGLVMFSFTFTLGTTSAMGTTPIFSAPTAISYSGKTSNVYGGVPMGMVSMENNGVDNYQGTCFQVDDTTNQIWMEAYEQTATYTRFGGITAALPFTWGTGDTIQARGWYRGPIS